MLLKLVRTVTCSGRLNICCNAEQTELHNEGCQEIVTYPNHEVDLPAFSFFLSCFFNFPSLFPRVRDRMVLEYVDQYNLISFYDRDSSEITIKVN